ncbi:MAG: hypothetical protein AAGF12_11645 [Myxococcota bacterium]
MAEPASDPELRDLLRPIAEVPSTPGEMRRRVRENVERSIDTPAEAPPQSGGGLTTGQAATMTVLGTLSGLAVGALVGFWLGTESMPDAIDEGHFDEPSLVSSPGSPEPSSLETVEENLDEPASEPITAEPTIDTAQPSRTMRQTGSSLEAERRLIDAAFAAFRDGNQEEAMRALDRHEARFPNGVLRQERETLRERLSP